MQNISSIYALSFPSNFDFCAVIFKGLFLLEQTVLFVSIIKNYKNTCFNCVKHIFDLCAMNSKQLCFLKKSEMIM